MANNMIQEDIIYDRAKESLRQYWRINEEGTNKKVIYQCAMIVYLIRQEYKEDTRSYSIMQEKYQEEKAKILQLSNKIRKNAECYKEAVGACQDTLKYIEHVVKPRVSLRAIA
jgi:hypothetical protein